MTSIVWMSEPLTHALRSRIPSGATVVKTTQEFIDAPRDAKTVSFVDSAAIAGLDRFAADLGPTVDLLPPAGWRKLVAAVSVGPVIAVCNEPLPMAIGWLQPHPWLSHVVSAATLERPMAEVHLRDVIMTATASNPPRLLDWLGPTPAGRRIRLTHASRCAERLERMGEFFESKNVAPRTITQLREAAGELLRNAFYAAPVAAGALKKPLSRNQDIALPDDSACDLAYGCRDDLAIVRVRDPFGSLSRRRLVEILTRRSRSEVRSDGAEAMGLWRVFSAASFVAVSVVQHTHTEFLVGIEGPRDDKADSPHPFAFHFFFKEGGQRTFWRLSDEDTGNPALNSSVSIGEHK